MDKFIKYWLNVKFTMFTDTHSHIHFRKEFPDVEAVLERAREANVSRQIIVGCTVKDSRRALEFVRDKEGLWSTLGVHPHNADQLTDAVLEEYTKTAMREEKVVALGEMGLDYYRNLKPHEMQQAAFEKQLQLANDLDLPVVVHVRDAWDDALKIMQNIGNTKVILHCFTGTMKHAENAWERGYHTSFSGVVTYPKNQYLRDVVEAAPENKILIETDCPYLTPQPYRGKRNEPAYIVETAKEIAKVRGVTLEEVAETTTKNSQDVFDLI